MPTDIYEEIFDKAEVGIALNDPEKGVVGLVNDRYAELMGYSHDELRDMKIEGISADDPSFDQEEAMERIQGALEGNTQRFDWLFERKDGDQFWAEVVLKRTIIGEQDRLLAFVRDISERKQNEQKLERQNERLDEFASIVSHDLRGPLNLAMARLKLAQEECDSEHLDSVERAQRRMDVLIEDVLSLARTGKSVIETQTVDLREVVQTCWRAVEVDSASLEIETSATVQADRTRLRQLLENLLRNAIDHGGDNVAITVGELNDGFFVEDDGPGVPENDRDQIFEAGYTTSRGGTGYGLRIVEQITEVHRWQVDVTTGRGGGARFEFTGVERD